MTSPGGPTTGQRIALSGNPEARVRSRVSPAGTGGTARTLPELLQLLRDGTPPIPLTDGQGNWQAMRLRRAGYTYGDISKAMDTYHGIRRAPYSWRNRLRKLGAPPATWSGRPIPPPSTYRRAA